MSEQELSRRQFGRRAVQATALAGTGLISQGNPPAGAADHQPAIAEPIPPTDIPVDLLLMEVVRRLYPDRKLTPEYLLEIRRDIATDLRRARAIRSVPLQNSDEPAALFAAYRNDGEFSHRAED